jgi:hypothetical protein
MLEVQDQKIREVVKNSSKKAEVYARKRYVLLNLYCILLLLTLAALYRYAALEMRKRKRLTVNTTKEEDYR